MDLATQSLIYRQLLIRNICLGWEDWYGGVGEHPITFMIVYPFKQAPQAVYIASYAEM